jgi:hypothetical protein
MGKSILDYLYERKQGIVKFESNSELSIDSATW